MYVTNVTTPANFFHMMRRQLARPFRKPLVNMSPKSLLRHPDCVSDIKSFETGNNFQEVIDDPTLLDTAKAASAVKKLLFCTGKVYYDLLAKQRENNMTNVAIVRIEQLYPFPEEQVQVIIKKYSKAKPYWVQEEPKNNGAWSYIATFHDDLGLKYIGRPASASPASGFVKVHNKEQDKLVAEALAV
jgi:2-oxoglutarate dehydrogenase E1 component